MSWCLECSIDDAHNFESLGLHLVNSDLILLNFAALCCVGPLAFYILRLAVLNRRECCTVVSGGWDYLLLLAGLSGFLLFGGLLLLSIVSKDSRLFLRGDLTDLRSVWDQRWLLWSITLAVYIGGLAVVFTLTFLARSRMLSVYNIALEDALYVAGNILASTVPDAKRDGMMWSNGTPVLSLNYFHEMRHASVQLHSTNKQQRWELERTLRDHLPRYGIGANPNAGWWGAAATAVVMFLLGLVGFLSLMLFVMR